MKNEINPLSAMFLAWLNKDNNMTKVMLFFGSLIAISFLAGFMTLAGSRRTHKQQMEAYRLQNELKEPSKQLSNLIKRVEALEQKLKETPEHE